MTYGEAVIYQKSTMRMQGGSWVSDPLPEHVRLSEADAFEYYSDKLNEYWDSLPPSEPAQKPAQGKRRKKEALPPSVIELLLEIKELAQKGLEATAMTTKDTKLRTIIKKIGKPEKAF